MVVRSVAAFSLVVWFGFFGASLANPLAWIGSLVFLVPAWVKVVRRLKAEIANGALILGMSVGTLLGILEIAFGRSLVTLFVGAGQHTVMDLAQLYFWANGPLYAILATLFVLRYTLQGLGAIGSVTLAAAVNTLGTDAVAANTAASKVDQIIIMVVMSFGVTMATYTAQNFGARKYARILVGVKIEKFGWGVEGAAFATVLAQFVSIAASHWHISRYTDTLHLTGSDFKLPKGELRQHMLAGVPMGFQQSIKRLMQTPADIFAEARVFIVIILAGTIATMGYNIISNAMRAVGDSKAPLYYLVVGMIFNISLELILI
ncbi:hypothetical protein H7R52_00440 [Weissella confusa]|uniref:Probable multidrug resistance protein NorM n=1 Tax=Weissella confusa TaxID=1583 RepID=A0A923SMI0_WEICO|nr:hypothetical protein [Weissella confusa]